MLEKKEIKIENGIKTVITHRDIYPDTIEKFDINGNQIYSKSITHEWWAEYDERGNRIHYKYSNEYEETREYNEYNFCTHIKNNYGEAFAVYKEGGEFEFKMDCKDPYNVFYLLDAFSVFDRDL